MTNKNKVENKNICAKCGGACCKKSGCGYLVSDFPSLKFESLKAKIDEGNISIKTVLFEVDNKIKQILLLKARSVDKGIVDLFSASSQCKMLTPNGCTYSLADRPSLGALLKPNPNGNCSISNDLQLATVKEWAKHQGVLEKLVKAYTGKSSNEVYHKQFIEASTVVLAKVKLLGGNFSQLDQADLEVFSAILAAQNYMPEAIKEANQLAEKTIAKLITKNKK